MPDIYDSFYLNAHHSYYKCFDAFDLKNWMQRKG